MAGGLIRTLLAAGLIIASNMQCGKQRTYQPTPLPVVTNQSVQVTIPKRVQHVNGKEILRLDGKLVLGERMDGPIYRVSYKLKDGSTYIPLTKTQ